MTYFNTSIPALDSDQDPAAVEVTASVGEFDGVLLALQLPDEYALVELSAEQADELIGALSAAVEVLRQAEA